MREKGFQVTIVDPVGEDPFETNPVPGRDLVSYGWSLEKIVDAIPADTKYVGISSLFSHEWPVCKRLAEMIRARFPDARIIAGGEHVTAAGDFSLRDCRAIDFAVLGEGEETFLELVAGLEAGTDPAAIDGILYLDGDQVVRTAKRQRVRDVDSIPWPAWDLVPLQNYLDNSLSYGVGGGRTMPIMATRGCPYRCTFCSSASMWTQRWYPRDVKDVVDEIETYIERYGADRFDFYDLTAIIKKDWIVAFCQELLDRGLDIAWQLPAGTRAEAIDDEVASLLSRSGHRNLVYAPESGSKRMLDLIEKRVKVPRMLESMRAAIRNGISVKLNMIVGFPDETHRDIFATYRFLVKTAWVGVDDVTIATFSPYPGSALFDGLQDDGTIPHALDEDYFFGLITMGDVKEAISFSKHIKGRTLLLYKLFGIFLFYSLSYLTHPSRIFRTIRNLYKNEHETRIEKALSALIAKVRRHGDAERDVSLPAGEAVRT